MVQFLILLAVAVPTTILLVWGIRHYLKPKRDRANRNRGPQPDFSALEGNQDDDFVPLPEAQPTDYAESVDRYFDWLGAEQNDERRFADGNYDPLCADDGHKVELTALVEPLPIFGTRVTVRQSCLRAARHMERCAQAMYNRHDFAEAEAFARAALNEVNRNMKRDHWYAPFILNWLAYLRYEQGFCVEARELWEQAEQIAIEWYEQCQQLLPDIRHNLQVFHSNF